MYSKMSSAICFNLDQSKILSSGNRLKNTVYGFYLQLCVFLHQAWQHGAKVLQISGEDDKQVHPKWHHHYKQNWPVEWKSNFELVTYPGAGHLIEPPYTPLCRAVNGGRKRMSTIDFIPPEFYGLSTFLLPI